MSEHILAWHFVDSNGKRRDGLKERVSVTYHVGGGYLVMCGRGLHASRRCLDALRYAPGAILRRVECWGSVIEADDKIVCRHRKVLWQRDVTRELHLFACRVAEDALTVARVTDKRSWKAIEAKRAWLDGKATDQELDAARAAAWAAAGAAARAAAWDAAWAAAWAAAGDAAWAAARAAAWYAARAAAGDAARAAAWYAARAAAGDAAWEKYNTWLENTVSKEERS